MPTRRKACGSLAQELTSGEFHRLCVGRTWAEAGRAPARRKRVTLPLSIPADDCGLRACGWGMQCHDSASRCSVASIVINSSAEVLVQIS
eukprot:3235814-Rhodomonas_salina.4